MINLFYGNVDGRETTEFFNPILYELDTHISWAYIDENEKSFSNAMVFGRTA